MSGILKGMGGQLVTDGPLDRDKLKNIGASAQQYQTANTDPNMDFLNNRFPLGNASNALSGYINNTSIGNPELGYEYNPYEPEKIADLIDAQDGGEGGTTGGEGDYSDLVTPSGTPMPGHPDYEAWMTAGGEGRPDGAQMSDHNGYVGNTFVGIGNALTSLGKVIPGFLGMGLHSVGQGMIGHDTTSIGPSGEGGVDGVDTYTTHGSFDVGEFSDDVATSAHGNAGPSSIGTNSFGDTVSVGYGAGQVDPSMAGAANFSGGGGGTASSSGNNAPSVDLSQGPPAYNYGGKVKKYGYGGPVAEQEDPYAPMPLATPMQATPFGGPLRGTPVDGSMETPWYQDVGQSVATSVITGALTKAIGLNKGGKVCPCGTPGCPGCGKGYNDGGRTPTIWTSPPYKYYARGPSTVDYLMPHTATRTPAELQEPVGDPTEHFSEARFTRDHFARADANPSMWKTEPMLDYRGWQGPETIRIPSGDRTTRNMPAELQSPVGDPAAHRGFSKLSTKDKIAIRESDAKIKREDMKAVADVAVKMKGPLQQGE